MGTVVFISLIVIGLTIIVLIAKKSMEESPTWKYQYFRVLEDLNTGVSENLIVSNLVYKFKISEQTAKGLVEAVKSGKDEDAMNHFKTVLG